MADGVFRGSDVVEHEFFGVTTNEEALAKNRLVQSGAVVVNPLLSQAIGSTKGMISITNLPDLDDDGFNRASDNNSDTVTGHKVSEQTQINWVLRRTQVWSHNALALEIAQTDPPAHIRARQINYWNRIYQNVIVATCRGVAANNILTVANGGNAGDMVHSTAGAANAAATATTKFSAAGFTTALVTNGDSMDDFAAIIVHSFQYKTMIDLNLVSDLPPSNAPGRYGTFLGRPIIVDDNVPQGTNAVTKGTNVAEAGVYTAIIVKPGAFQLGFGVPEFGFDSVDVNQGAGNAWGGFDYITRRAFVVHPLGFTYTTAATTSQNISGPNDTSLATAAYWNRVYARKNVGLTFYSTRET